jgi:hypothetical protein
LKPPFLTPDDGEGLVIMIARLRMLALTIAAVAAGPCNAVAQSIPAIPQTPAVPSRPATPAGETAREVPPWVRLGVTHDSGDRRPSDTGRIESRRIETGSIDTAASAANRQAPFRYGPQYFDRTGEVGPARRGEAYDVKPLIGLAP